MKNVFCRTAVRKKIKDSFLPEFFRALHKGTLQVLVRVWCHGFDVNLVGEPLSLLHALLIKKQHYCRTEKVVAKIRHAKQR